MLIPSLFVAARLLVQDPCGDGPWLDAEVTAGAEVSVGQATVAGLEANAMPYRGDASGIVSIRDTVSGDAAIEVINNVEMRAYGWCFSLNGVEPSEMPDKVPVTGEDDVVRWYFGYAHYRNGEWLSYCTPTHLERPHYICN